MLRSYREREDEAPNFDNVAGEVQVSEQWKLVAPPSSAPQLD
jgi:hypothetical protein